jgi:transcriptional regulator with XRE-family HTH domain
LHEDAESASNVAASPRGPSAAARRKTAVGFVDEREIAERALESADLDDGAEPVFPPVARRFLQARESLGLTQSEVAAQWGQDPSAYWDLEFHDSEAFDVVSVQDVVTLAAILRVSVMHLLFGEEPSPPLPATTYAEVIRRLRDQMTQRTLSVDEMSDLVGWELAEYLDDPDKLAELPIFGLRWVCKTAGVDWATTLRNPTARAMTG